MNVKEAPAKDSRNKLKKEKKKKRKKSSGSDSSSSSSSSGDSDSDDEELEKKPNRKYIQWQAKKHHKRRYKADMITRAESLHFKKRKDLLAFAQKYPGGLAAHFLYQVRRKLLQPAPQDSYDILATDSSSWASSFSDLKDIRDLKEVQFLTKIMAEVSLGRLPQAMDLCAMRVREIRMAKAPQGSWEKAAAVSLLSAPLPSNTALPDGAFTL
jgi:hypothetical protein